MEDTMADLYLIKDKVKQQEEENIKKIKDGVKEFLAHDNGDVEGKINVVQLDLAQGVLKYHEICAVLDAAKELMIENKRLRGKCADLIEEMMKKSYKDFSLYGATPNNLRY
jgi:DNA polymerase III delta prime subunit